LQLPGTHVETCIFYPLHPRFPRGDGSSRRAKTKRICQLRSHVAAHVWQWFAWGFIIGSFRAHGIILHTRDHHAHTAECSTVQNPQKQQMNGSAGVVAMSAPLRRLQASDTLLLCTLNFSRWCAQAFCAACSTVPCLSQTLPSPCNLQRVCNVAHEPPLSRCVTSFGFRV